MLTVRGSLTSLFLRNMLPMLPIKKHQNYSQWSVNFQPTAHRTANKPAAHGLGGDVQIIDVDEPWRLFADLQRVRQQQIR